MPVSNLRNNIIHLCDDVFGFPESRLDVESRLPAEPMFDVQFAVLDGELEVSLVIYDGCTLGESLEKFLVVVENGAVGDVINIFHNNKKIPED